MKTAKLVIGIITIVYSVVVFAQTIFYDTAKYIGNGLFYLIEQEQLSNLISIMLKSGYLVAALMLAAGITSIVARDSYGGAISCTVLFAISGVIAYSGIVGYIVEHRIIPSIYCLAATLFFGVSMFVQHYDVDKEDTSKDSSEENIDTF